MIVTHRSRVFYTRFQIKNKKRTNLGKKKNPKKERTQKKKEDRRRREEPIEDLKKEQRDAG